MICERDNLNVYLVYVIFPIVTNCDNNKMRSHIKYVVYYSDNKILCT